MRGKPKEPETAPTKGQQANHGRFCTCLRCRSIQRETDALIGVGASKPKMARAGQKKTRAKA